MAVKDHEAVKRGEIDVKKGELFFLIEKITIVQYEIARASMANPELGLIPADVVEFAKPKGSVVAKEIFEPSSKAQISIRKGDQLKLYNAEGDWALVGDSRGLGLVPILLVERSKTSISIFKTKKDRPEKKELKKLKKEQIDLQEKKEKEKLIKKKIQHEKEALLEKMKEEKELLEQKQKQGKDDLTMLTPDITPPRPILGSERNASSSTLQSVVSRSSMLSPASSVSSFSKTSWQVIEIDGRKKHPVTIEIAEGSVAIIQKDSVSLWPAKDIVRFSLEKKHVFVDFKPDVGFEFVTTTRSEADEIISSLGEICGAVRAKALEEVKNASQKVGKGYKTAQALYDFLAENRDELSCNEGDLLYIIDDTKSEDWWLCENIISGKRGVVASTYLSVMGKGLDKKRTRLWTDRSGEHKVEAQYLGMVDGLVQLQKTLGAKLLLAPKKLSLLDLEYLKDQGADLGGYLEKRRARAQLKEKRNKDWLKHKLKELPKAPLKSALKKPKTEPKTELNWIDFFHACRVGSTNASLYASFFDRVSMDQLPQMDAARLRKLHVKEKDILKILSVIEERYPEARSKPETNKLAFEPPSLPLTRTVSNSLVESTGSFNGYRTLDPFKTAEPNILRMSRIDMLAGKQPKKAPEPLERDGSHQPCEVSEPRKSTRESVTVGLKISKFSKVKKKGSHLQSTPTLPPMLERRPTVLRQAVKAPVMHSKPEFDHF